MAYPAGTTAEDDWRYDTRYSEKSPNVPYNRAMPALRERESISGIFVDAVVRVQRVRRIGADRK